MRLFWCAVFIRFLTIFSGAFFRQFPQMLSRILVAVLPQILQWIHSTPHLIKLGMIIRKGFFVYDFYSINIKIFLDNPPI